MNITDHEIQAYVDGELAPDDVARIDAAIASDVMVAARVEREKRLRAKLRGAYDPVLSEPVPARLQALLAADAARDAPHRADNVVELQPRRPSAGARWRTPVIALAASVAALAVSLWLRPAGPVRMQDGQLVAHGALARELDTALASAPAAGAATSVGLTFRDVDGRICRSFVQGEIALAGLACRENGRWVLPVVSRAEPGAEAGVRQASSAAPAEVQAAIDARLQGDVFDAAQERAARDAGWR
ncbi:MAG: anti-sigma factor family protein [Pseudomonadota bacterium]